ncbi:MAG: MarR family transcriptional regulator, partial [Kibdelosporangium sp.]
MEGLRHDLHWMLARLKVGLGAAEARALQEHGMTHWGYTVLMAVVDTPAQSQLALAQTIVVDKSKLVLILDELEAAGLVQRRPDPADRRARIIEATPRGVRTLEAAGKDIRALEEQLLAGLGSAQRRTFRNVLSHLVGEPLDLIESGQAPADSC